jgi:ABC-type Zn uptake system ZnuABC Zn-binding protein ZnuA
MALIASERWRMWTRGLFALALVAFLSPPARAQEKLRVVGTIPDLVDLAKQVGGERIEATTIAVGYQDPHYVDPKPSFVVMLNKADCFIQVGLDLEIGWLPPLLSQSRNAQIQRGGVGYIDASEGIEVLQRPSGRVSRSEGDIHIYGNPHYWLDPLNGKHIAAHIERVFSRLRPEWAAEFRGNLEQFESAVDRSLERWLARMAPYRGRKVVAYHNSWPYFERRFGIEIAAFVEPKPGIPPSPQDLVRVITLMRRENIGTLIHTVYYDEKPSRFVVEKTNAQLITLATSVGGREGVDDYFDLFDENIELLIGSLAQSTATGD